MSGFHCVSMENVINMSFTEKKNRLSVIGKPVFYFKAKSAYFAPKMSKYPAMNTTRMIIGAIHLR